MYLENGANYWQKNFVKLLAAVSNDISDFQYFKYFI